MEHRSSLTLVSTPAALPLTLAEVKVHLRVADEITAEDNLITALIETATAHLDGRDGILNRALVAQSWELRMNCFPYDTHSQNPYDAVWDRRIDLPLPPLISIDSVSYIDEGGTLQTLDPSTYQVISGGFGRAALVEAYLQDWPSTRDEPEAVRVRFTAGYVTPSGSPPMAAEGIPMPIKQAMKLIIGDLYENREAAIAGVAITSNPSASILLSPYIVGGLGAI